MPRKEPYVRLDYPERRCIVCQSAFKPWRIDQVYCSTRDNDRCLQSLYQLELRINRNRPTLIASVIIAQGHCCRGCGAPGVDAPKPSEGTNPDRLSTAPRVVLRALLLAPSKADPNGPVSEISIEDIAATCKPCRLAYHRSYSEQLSKSAHSSIS